VDVDDGALVITALINALLCGGLGLRMLHGLLTARRRMRGTVADQEEDPCWGRMVPS
jgi:hypothetical protein